MSVSFLVPPEYPLVLNRWGRQLNGTVLGPMEEGDDIMLTCRVVGGKPRNKFNASIQWLIQFQTLGFFVPSSL